MEETVLLFWGHFYPQIFEGPKSRIPRPSVPRRILQSVWSNKHLLMTLCIPGGSAGKESTCKVGDLGWDDPLEKGTATPSSILAWRIPWTV